MLEEVKVRERKSAKHGKTYEYRFEIVRSAVSESGAARAVSCLNRKQKR